MNQTTITLYVSDNCPACNLAKQWFERHGVKPEIINLNDSPADRLNRMGFMSVPILRVGDDYLVGFQPARWEKALKEVTHGQNQQP